VLLPLQGTVDAHPHPHGKRTLVPWRSVAAEARRVSGDVRRPARAWNRVGSGSTQRIAGGQKE